MGAPSESDENYAQELMEQELKRQESYERKTVDDEKIARQFHEQEKKTLEEKKKKIVSDEEYALKLQEEMKRQVEAEDAASLALALQLIKKSKMKNSQHN